MIEAGDADLATFLKSKGSTAAIPAPTALATTPGAPTPVTAASPIVQPMNTVREIASSGSGMIGDIANILKNATELIKAAQELGLVPRSAQRKLDAMQPQAPQQPQPMPTYEKLIQEAQRPVLAPQKEPVDPTKASEIMHRWLLATFEEWEKKDSQTSVGDLIGIWKREDKKIKEIIIQLLGGASVSPATSAEAPSPETKASTPPSSEQPQPTTADSSTENSDSAPTEEQEKSPKKIGKHSDTGSRSKKSADTDKE